MSKKCSVCQEQTAKFAIKDSSEYYCKECADENFGDISLLVKVESQAQILKEILEKSE